ncbi:flap endonuclease GEN-like 2 isoform X1 [Olea europaea subsp. europaea]|uniref:Flap endonuclease GEN-like 2 isoform X1 n=1 Tax=Olea europaea subsp. europaea TaxID=158383 RepID=A0A8S0REQ2_OLEEU|nr:flap endonuclease GEN-like 2 isoform X1 [Olea europaea subsp. europaea]
MVCTDGSIPAIKLSTYRRRLNPGKEATLDDENPQKVAPVRRNMGSEFSCMIKEAKVLGTALGIPCLDGIEEAEAQCALLNSESLCDGCFTSDSDAFLFGARTVYRDICLGEGGYVVCYEMDDIERKLGFGRNSLITLAILLGSDYSQGVRGFGPESACQIVKSIGDSAILQRIASEGFSISKKAIGSKKQGRNCAGLDSDGNKSNLQRDYLFLQVIDAYLKPKCHSADSDAVHRVLALYPFRRSQLHQICALYFDWPPEKTDEYILPKIAERDLRRFANLRSTSSGLGVHHALNEMPVKCPMSGIIKQRKHQGRDYFEVSWENIDGLKQSTVPADLVQSACPETIMEFEQKRDQEKKPNSRRSRPKKVETRADMKEIDQKLEKLLLEIEQKNTPMHNAVSLGGSVLEETCTGTKSKSNSGRSQERNNGESSMSGFYSTASSDSTAEIIDLTSPAPPVRAIGVSPCQDMKCTDVIELSESENDMSPEHTVKARELRLFISSIRDEIY